jgi:hypothetical protein
VPDREGYVDVVIVYAHDPDTDGPDLDRIGTVESYPKPVARSMVNNGAARWPDNSPHAKPLDQMGRAELLSEARVRGIDIARGATRTEVFETVSKAVQEQAAQAADQQHVDLESMTIAELRDNYPAAADMPANTKKADLIAAIEAAQAEQDSAAEVDADGEASEAPDVTVAPGAEHNPDPDLTGRPQS